MAKTTRLNLEKVISILKEHKEELKEKYGVTQIILFGSFAKSIQTKKSDIDIVVRLKKPLGLEFVRLAYFLEEFLGKKVDVATFECFQKSFNNPRYRHIAEDIERSLIYV